MSFLVSDQGQAPSRWGAPRVQRAGVPQPQRGLARRGCGVHGRCGERSQRTPPPLGVNRHARPPAPAVSISTVHLGGCGAHLPETSPNLPPLACENTVRQMVSRCQGIAAFSSGGGGSDGGGGRGMETKCSFSISNSGPHIAPTDGPPQCGSLGCYLIAVVMLQLGKRCVLANQGLCIRYNGLHTSHIVLL